MAKSNTGVLGGTGGQYGGSSKVGKKGGYAKQQPSSNRSKSVSGGGLVTGGLKPWSGASGSAGGTAGKTFGSVKGGKPSGVGGTTGHVPGRMPGNMMGHTGKTVPFQNTGNHPKGGKVLEVSTQPLTSSQAKDPGAAKLDGAYKAKLQASHGRSMPGSWSGASGSVGGASGKTVGSKGSLKK